MCIHLFCPECSGTLSLDGHLLKQVDATYDLGLEVLSNLKWDLHIRTKLSRARNNFNYLRHNAPYNLLSRVKLNLCYARVLSTLLYGSQMWSPDVSHIRLMENFHLKCLSWCFGRTDYLLLLRRANSLPISYHLIERDLDFFLAIRSGRSCIQFDNYFAIRQNQRCLRSDTVQHMSSSGYKRNLTGRSFFYRIVSVSDFIDFKVFNLLEPPSNSKSPIKTFFKNCVTLSTILINLALGQ